MTNPSNPLSADKIADLLTKAKAATPGEWVIEGWGGDLENLVLARKSDCRVIAKLVRHPRSLNNGTYIAAANPETILRLIATIEQRDEQIEKLRKAVEYCAAAHGELNPANQAQFMVAREALSATEPKP